MSLLEGSSVNCPYCGQIIDITVDGSIPDQNYVEDCQVCCRPIVFAIHIDDNQDPIISVRMENE